MGMSVGGGGGVKAEPNVVPMIDVMLVLLIIFMVTTNLIAAGFNAEPPQGINLKAHPEVETDQVLGIDKTGQYFLNKKPINNADLGRFLNDIYTARTSDKILYIKADKELAYGAILDAMDIAAHNGVVMVGAITNQQPGTTSTVEGDDPTSKVSQP